MGDHKLREQACEENRIGRRFSTISSLAVENAVNLELGFSADFNEDEISSEAIEKTRAPFWRRYLGVFFMIISCACFGLCGITIKLIPIHPINLTIIRFVGLLVPAFIIIPYNQFCHPQASVLNNFLSLNWKEKRRTLFLLLLRSTFGCLSVISFYWAIKTISLGDVAVVGFTLPIIIVFLAYFLLKEPFSSAQLITCFVALIGVFIISRPPFLTGAKAFDTTTLIGIGLALGNAFLMSTVMILLRFLRNTNFMLITTVFGTWGMCLSLAIAFGFQVFELPQGLYNWTVSACLAMLTFCGQVTLTLALKYEQSGVISLVKSLDVVFAFVYQYVFLGVVPDFFSIIGAVIVVSAVFLICFRKFLLEMPPEAELRKKFWFLMK